MARSSISTPNLSEEGDNGTIELATIQGEQRHRMITLGWLADLTGFNIFMRIVEAENDGAGTRPTAEKSNGVTKVLSPENGLIFDITGNTFKFVIPWDLGVGFSPLPAPGAPVYAFFELEVGEPGTGDAISGADAAPPSSQVWKPMRGLIAISYSPTEG